DQRRNSDRAADGQPAVAAQIQNQEEITWEKRCRHSPQLSGVANRLVDLRQERPEALRTQVELSLALAFRPGVYEKPSLVRRKRPRGRKRLRHDQFRRPP